VFPWPGAIAIGRPDLISSNRDCEITASVPAPLSGSSRTKARDTLRVLSSRKTSPGAALLLRSTSAKFTSLRAPSLEAAIIFADG